VLVPADEQELGLPIPDKAIEQMKANLELDEEQMTIAAEEEKKRRRKLRAARYSASR
jgi:adenylosuccinate lyase